MYTQINSKPGILLKLALQLDLIEAPSIQIDRSNEDGFECIWVYNYFVAFLAACSSLSIRFLRLTRSLKKT